MVSREEDRRANQTEDVSGCDESKCVSTGRSNLHDGSFTCYGDKEGIFHPMMCADGFQPVVVEDQPTTADESEGITFSYFTCCPPNQLSSEVSRHCSDPITAPMESTKAENDANANNVCKDQGRQKYPRSMKSPALDGQLEPFLCCDSLPITAVYDDDDINATASVATEFLDDVECVPYSNPFYKIAEAHNQIGKLGAIYCNVPEGEFWFARPIGEEDATLTGRYQCCKTGPSLPPFVQDSMFKINVYPSLILYGIACILSVVVVVGLLIPLGIELYKKRQETKTPSSTMLAKSPESRSLGFSCLSLRTGPASELRGMPRTSRVRRKMPRYSTYNLYLVYLAILDLSFSSYMLSLNIMYINQTFDPTRNTSLIVSIWDLPYSTWAWDNPVIVPYIAANFWINAIIAHEVLLLLATSYRRQKIEQPSLTKVHLLGGGVCFAYGIAAWGVHYLTESTWDPEDVQALDKVLSIFKPTQLALVQLPPAFYIVYVSTIIWWRGYMPSQQQLTSPTIRAMRELVLYFARIVAVFFGIWVPMAIVWRIATTVEGQEWASCVVLWLNAIQPIVTFCFVVTKSDAKRYIWNLVTLSYLFGDCCDGRIRSANDKAPVQREVENPSVPENENNPFPTRNAEADRVPEAKNDEDVSSLIHSVLGWSSSGVQTETIDFEPNTTISAAFDSATSDSWAKSSDVEADEEDNGDISTIPNP